MGRSPSIYVKIDDVVMWMELVSFILLKWNRSKYFIVNGSVSTTLLLINLVQLKAIQKYPIVVTSYYLSYFPRNGTSSLK